MENHNDSEDSEDSEKFIYRRPFLVLLIVTVIIWTIVLTLTKHLWGSYVYQWFIEIQHFFRDNNFLN